jgi:cyclo(L-tyrosyl-L-tyrosyl) synthase
MRYLVAELPLFLDSTAIFSVGSSLIFYHQPVPLAELIFAGGSTLSAASQQAYAVIRPAAAVPRATASASGR